MALLILMALCVVCLATEFAGQCGGRGGGWDFVRTVTAEKCIGNGGDVVQSGDASPSGALSDLQGLGR